MSNVVASVAVGWALPTLHPLLSPSNREHYKHPFSQPHYVQLRFGGVPLTSRSFRQFVADGFYGENWGCWFAVSGVERCGGKQTGVFEGKGRVVGE